MAEVASRTLRNNTRALLRRVEAGEAVTITVDGRAVAVLTAVTARPRWIASTELVRLLAVSYADNGLTAELAKLSPDSTDDLPPL